MIKLATIGTSTIAKAFMSAVQLCDRVQLVAVYSRKFETGLEFGKLFGCENVYTDLYEMAKSGIDAVYIASPNVFHYAQSKIFIENGVNVICEKPITSNLEQYKELKKLADEKGVVYMEAIMSRHSPAYNVIQSSLKEIGNVSLARIDFCQRSSRLDNFYKGIPQNIFDMSLHAGTLNDLGVYCVYAALDLFGVPRDIIAVADYFDNGADCSGTAVLRYDNFSAVLTYAKNGQSKACSEIIGDAGTLKIESISQYIGVTLCKQGEDKTVYPMLEKEKVMLGEVEAFADYIENKDCEEYKKASELCYNVQLCMDKIKESANIVYP